MGIRPQRFRPLQFVAKFALVRLVADIAFYLVHRVLHTRQLYPYIHKRHHEHKATGIYTNYHFTITDLLLEGFAPVFVSLQTLMLLKVPFSQYEQMLMTCYVQWYEIGSHSGKPMPTLTYLPPLAPLYRLLLGDVDRRNVEFHEAHHALTHCNYGITQWIDVVLGSAKYLPPAKKD